MKKIILTMVLAVLPLLANAQVFRGFVDLYGGTSFSGGFSFNKSECPISDVKPDLVIGLNFTGGYQFTNYLFAGVGFGGYVPCVGYDDSYGDRQLAAYSMYFPVYADVRWTLNINSRVTPFVDMKIGYQLGTYVGEGDDFDDYYGESEPLQALHKNGVYFQPSIGFRFGKATAFNLGLAYNTSIGTRFMAGRVKDGRRVREEVGSMTKGALMLTLGVDF